MITRRTFFLTGTAVAGGAMAMNWFGAQPKAAPQKTFEVTKTDEEWKKLLAPEQYQVLRKHGTERAGSSPLDREKRAGLFQCAGCDLPVYSSTTKFESGTGWPSFTAPIEKAIGTRIDRSLLGQRIEVHCRRCGGHLGHVFNDGPRPTGKRYCMNGAAMVFRPAAQGE